MQKIYFGAPGTGKSFYIDTCIIKKMGIPDDRVFRVTFYPDFSYSDFIGQLVPVVSKSAGKTSITYDFQKGIFTTALEKAYEDTSKEVYLIIEEMSRGDCATIFGDIFQLLDRESSGVNKGYSKYFISNDVISKDIPSLPGNHIKLPPNFNILGTMNTSDQNVYVMDTAFKRRFEWEYISTTPPKKDGTGSYLNNADIDYNDGTTTKTIKWCVLYQKLNDFIVSENYLGLDEDKQLGQFYIEFDIKGGKVKEQVKNKLLQYLWNDVHKASFKEDVRLFDPSVKSFGNLYTKFEKNQKVFSDQFISLLP